MMACPNRDQEPSPGPARPRSAPSPARRVPDPERRQTGGRNHPQLMELTRILADIIVGEEAGRLLASPTVTTAMTDPVHLGDVWLWREPRLDVGRKARARDGGAYQLPIRVIWAAGPVGTEPGRSRRRHDTALFLDRPRTWSAHGMGWRLSGELSSSADLARTQSGRTQSGRTPSGRTPSGRTQSGGPGVTVLNGQTAQVLAGLVENGRAARWKFITWLEPILGSYLRKAHAGIRTEIAESRTPAAHRGTIRPAANPADYPGKAKPKGSRAGTAPAAGPAAFAPPLVDDVKLDQLRDHMLFGDGDSPSAADRLLALCTAPTTFTKVDPLRYVTAALRRDSATTLRRAIGDPHVGRKVRSLARELGTTDVTTVVAEYRRRWPADHVAPDRAEQALSVGSDPMARWAGFHEDMFEGDM